MNKKGIIIYFVAAVLIVALTVSGVLLVNNKFPQASSDDGEIISSEDDGVYAISEADTVKTLEYDFSSEYGDGVRMNTVFLYKEACKLSENPQLAMKGSFSKARGTELRIAATRGEITEIDIDELEFEGQIYHKDWIYFNLTEHFVYYKGKMYKYYYELSFDTEDLRENSFKKYTGSYKFGEKLEKHKFLSGTVLKEGNKYLLKLLEDEPLAELCEFVRPANSVKEGERITIEYTGYVELGNPAVIVNPVGVYEYDEDFEYEKTMPTVLNVAVSKSYESEVFLFNDPKDYLGIEESDGYAKHKVIIKTFEEFKKYEEFYKAAFNFTYKPEFFEKNSLAMIYFEGSTGSYNFTYMDFYIKDNAIHIEMNDGVEYGDAVNDDIGEYSFTAALPKSETENCTEIIIHRY